MSVPLILAALVPAAPPVRPPVTAGAGQLYDVGFGTVPLMPSTGVTLKAIPLHVEVVTGLIIGIGLTVMLILVVVGAQVPAVVVTVMVLTPVPLAGVGV